MAVSEVGFNRDTVVKVVGKNVDAHKAFEKLTEASFITGRAGLISFLPAVRKVLLKYGEQVSPDRIAEIREKIK
jgi:hypothetical protein